MNRKILMLALLMCTTPALAAGGSVYKWTDEEGVTHFGDRQPTGSNAEQVNVRSGSSSPAAGSGRQSPQERLSAIEERERNERQRQEETAEEEARRKQREANCATARSNLEIIRRNARIRTEENGETRYLEPDEIEEQRQQFERMARENCNPEQTPAER